MFMAETISGFDRCEKVGASIAPDVASIVQDSLRLKLKAKDLIQMRR